MGSNFITALFNGFADLRTRTSINKDLEDDIISDRFFNSLKGIKEFDAVILSIDDSELSLASQVASQEPLIVAAKVRPLKIHDKTLPNPCDYNEPEQIRYVTSLHPTAYSEGITNAGAGSVPKPGDIVECYYGISNPDNEGKGRGLRFRFKSKGSAAGNFPIRCLKILGAKTKDGKVVAQELPRSFEESEQSTGNINEKNSKDPANYSPTSRASETDKGVGAGIGFSAPSSGMGVDASTPDVPYLAWEAAMVNWIIYKNLLKKSEVITMVDFRIPSNQKRLWAVRLLPSTAVGSVSHTTAQSHYSLRHDVAWKPEDHIIVAHTYCTHGHNGPKKGVPTHFNNTEGSKESSLGAWLTPDRAIADRKESRVGKKCIWMKKALSGPCINNVGVKRGMYMHYASYAKAGSRSWGCWGIEDPSYDPLFDYISGGSMVYNYFCADVASECTKNPSRQSFGKKTCTDEDRREYKRLWPKLIQLYKDKNLNPESDEAKQWRLLTIGATSGFSSNSQY